MLLLLLPTGSRITYFQHSLNSGTSPWSSILLLVANGHHNCIKFTKADVRLTTPDDGQKGCPKHVVS